MHIMTTPGDFISDSKRLTEMQLASKFINRTEHNESTYIGRVEAVKHSARFLYYSGLYRKSFIIIDINYNASAIEPLLTYALITAEDFRLQSAAQYRQDSSKHLELMKTISLSYTDDLIETKVDQAIPQFVNLVFLDFINGELKSAQTSEDIVAATFGYISPNLLPLLQTRPETKFFGSLLAEKLQTPLSPPDKHLQRIFWPDSRGPVKVEASLPSVNAVVKQNPINNTIPIPLKKISSEKSHFSLFSDGTTIVKFGHPIKQKAIFKDGVLKKLQTYQRIDGDFQLLKTVEYEYQPDKSTGRTRIIQNTNINGVITSSTHGTFCVITRTILRKILKLAAASSHIIDHEAGVAIGEAYINILKAGRELKTNGVSLA